MKRKLKILFYFSTSERRYTALAPITTRGNKSKKNTCVSRYVTTLLVDIMIVGTGIDIVFIPRIEQIVNKHGQRFLNRAFHPYEIQTFQSQNKNKGIEFLASR